MSTLVTDEHVTALQRGQSVTITRLDDDDWSVTGQLIGVERNADGPQLRVLGEVDRLEYRIGLPARVTVHVR